MDSCDYIVFQGTLAEYLRRVEAGELASKLQASHAPPCKFQTAAAVISGINNVVPIVHGPRGCAQSLRGARVAGCQYRGRPYEPTLCTALDESQVVFGGEGKLARAIVEADRRYHPDLIVVMSTCCPGITGDDIEGIAEQLRGQVRAEIATIRSEGFGGDFRSGHEDAFRVIVDLMEPPKETIPYSVNLVGARVGPSYTEVREDIQELQDMLGQFGAKLHGVIAGGCTLAEIKRAPCAAVNTSWCFDWGRRIGLLMQERFSVPFCESGLPYGLGATADWVLKIAESLGLLSRAQELIARETERVTPDLEEAKRLLAGRRALIETGPMRAIALARMAAELGMQAVIFNMHPYTLRERKEAIQFLLDSGENPKVVLTRGAFEMGSYGASKQTQDEMEALIGDARDWVYFGTPARFPGVPLVNLATEIGQPHFGFTGVQNIARRASSAMRHAHRERSGLMRQAMYGVAIHGDLF
jgi:nitrogenase molybdenum-iron protein alpha/beta subunit